MVAEANQRRLKAKTLTEPIDEKWKYAYYLVKCIYYGEARQRGKGIRPKQKHFAKGCTAMIRLVSYDGDLVKLVWFANVIYCTTIIWVTDYPSSRRLNQVEQKEVNSIL